MHEFELLRSVASRHEIHLITSDHGRSRMRDAVIGLGVTVEFVRWREQSYPRTRLGKGAALLRRHPTTEMGLRRRRLAAVARAIAGWEAAHRVDLLQVMQGEFAPLTGVTTAPASLLLFDVYLRQTQRELELRVGFAKRARWIVERTKARAWEKKWYPRASAIACVSSVDADVLSDLLDRPVKVIPNLIGDHFFEPPDRARLAETVTLVSSLAYRPNIDALEWLVDEIWPLVVKQCPAARLVVAGSAPVDVIREAVQQAGAELHADVPDVRPYYWEASVALAPLRLGSGLRNKIIHAMACGAPLVATPAALEGIPATAPDHLLVAEDAQGFADAVVDVLRRPQEAAARAERARAVAERYRFTNVGAVLEKWWQAARP